MTENNYAVKLAFIKPSNFWKIKSFRYKLKATVSFHYGRNMGTVTVTVTVTVKEKIVEIVKAQPEDSSYDEILREIVFERMVERGLEDSRKESVISNETMEHRIRTWQK